MAAVTTPPQVFTWGCRMLLKTGTLLTWHCPGEGYGHGGEVASSPGLKGRHLGGKGPRDKGQALVHPSPRESNHPIYNLGPFPVLGVCVCV